MTAGTQVRNAWIVARQTLARRSALVTRVNGVLAQSLALLVFGLGAACAQTATTTGIFSNLNPSSFSQQVDWTATVTGSSPTGTVTFMDGSTAIGAVALGGTGNSRTAKLSSSALSQGTHSITAAYGGDAANQASTSSALTQTVNRIASTAILTSSAGTSTPETYSCYRLSSFSGSGCGYNSCEALATGLQQTFGGTPRICHGTAPQSMYLCDSTQACAAVLYTTTPAAAAVTYPQGVTLTATVTNSVSPTGTVTFKDGTTVLANVPLSGGAATYSANLGAASHALSAVYPGDTSNQSSTGLLNLTVTKESSSVAFGISANPSVAGTGLTVTATVSASSALGGTVTFTDGATTLAAVPLVTGVATANIRLGGGTHNLLATYSGDANHASANSTPIVETITTAPTTLTLAATPSNGGAGQNITLDARVLGGYLPSGVVTFTEGGMTLGTAAVSAGAATLGLNTLAVGTHSITASYAGDANNQASSAPAAAVTIGARAGMTWQYGYDSMGRMNTAVDPNGLATYYYYDALGRRVQTQQPPNTGATAPTVTQFTYDHVGGGVGSTDLNFADVALLLHADGSDNSTSIPDSSVLARSVVARGAAKLSTAQKQFGSASMVFDGASDVSAADTTMARFGTGDWTVEGWVRYNGPTSSANYDTFFSVGDGSTRVMLRLADWGYGNALQLLAMIGGSYPFTNATIGKTEFQNTQKHVVMQRRGSNIEAWVDGVLTNTVSVPSLNLAGSQTTIGSNFQTQYFHGNIDEVRVTKGVARYVGAFTPPASAFPDTAPDNNPYTESVIDPRALPTTYAIDGQGNVRTERSPDRGTIQSMYDANGNLLTSTDARGKTTTYTYDLLDRVISATYASGTPTTFEYDGGATPVPGAAGQLTKMSDESGQTLYAYDALGRLTSKAVTIGAKTFKVSYTWGDTGIALDKLTSITYPSGSQVNYTYDAKGSLNAITATPASGGGAVSLLSQITYNADRQVQSWQWSDGTVRTISYDDAGNMASYTLGNPAGSGAQGGVLRQLQRDAAGRITGYTHVNRAGAVPALDQSFAYDNLDRLVSATTATGTIGYTYDATGNRTAKTAGGTVYPNTIDTVSNKLLTVQDAAGTSPVSYDAAGNVTGDGTNTYTYSDRGRMATASPGSLGFAYNGMGQRALKQGPAIGPTPGNTYYVYDEAGQLLGEYDGNGNPVYETVYLRSAPVGVLKSSGVYNVYSDQIDTPRIITAQDQTIAWRWDAAEAFGATAPDQNPSGAGAFVFNHRFPGQVFDAETGLNQNWNREYRAIWGRYVQSDPVGLSGGINTYMYSYGGPIDKADATGLVPNPGELACLLGPNPVCIGGIAADIATWILAPAAIATVIAVAASNQPDCPATAQDCTKAIKLLKQVLRLSQKLGKKLTPERVQDLRRKISDGTITSNDLPGDIQQEFPPSLRGKTLNEIIELCKNAR